MNYLDIFCPTKITGPNLRRESLATPKYHTIHLSQRERRKNVAQKKVRHPKRRQSFLMGRTLKTQEICLKGLEITKNSSGRCGKFVLRFAYAHTPFSPAKLILMSIYINNSLVKNRQAAQQFRKRQKQYIQDLEKRCNTLTAQNAAYW